MTFALYIGFLVGAIALILTFWRRRLPDPKMYLLSRLIKQRHCCSRTPRHIRDIQDSFVAGLKASQEDAQSRVRHAESALTSVAAVNARPDAFERRLDELEKRLLAE